MFRRMIFGSILRRKARMLIVVLAVTVGAGIASTLINFYYDVDIKMTRELRSHGANMMIAPAGLAAEAPGTGTSGTGQAPVVMDESLRPTLRRALADHSVLAQTPYFYAAAQAGAVYLTLVGTDVQGLRQLNNWWKIDGRWMSEAADPPECMIGRQVARQLGLRRDQMLSLKAGAGAAEPEHRLRIAGVIETGSAEENQVFVALPVAWAVSGQSGKINTVALNALGTGEQIERLAQSIERQVPGVRAKPIRQIAQSEGWILAKIKWMLLVTTAIILMITAICAMTTLAASVMERSQEVALMKALGAGNAQIAQLLLSEVLVLAAVGGLAGYLVGLGVAHLLEQNLFQSGITVRPVLLPIIILIAGGLLLLASLVAVRRALEIQPAALLKGE